jgi:glycosyltransferase involved in cell wall biosynthesis
MARIIGVRIVLFQWDIYPSTFDGRTNRSSRLRSAFNWLEGKTIKMAHTIVVPSTDFLAFVDHSDVREMPIWPTNPEAMLRISESKIPLAAQSPVSICFVGQLNELRGLDLAVKHLCRVSTSPIEIHVFSSDKLPDGLERHKEAQVKIIHHGYLKPEKLQARLRKMHFGLISLHPQLDQPGFPSKVFDIVTAGLPVLYYGRPLEGFTNLLQQTNVGRDITSDTTLDLVALHNSLSQTFEQARVKFYDSTKLRQSQLSTLFENT